MVMRQQNGWMGWVNNILLAIVAVFAGQMLMEMREMRKEINSLNMDSAVYRHRLNTHDDQIRELRTFPKP